MRDEREFLTLSEAAARLGVSEPALRRRVERGQLPTFTNPGDLRSKLIRAADLDAYAVPAPVLPTGQKHGSGEGAMSAA